MRMFWHTIIQDVQNTLVELKDTVLRTEAHMINATLMNKEAEHFLDSVKQLADQIRQEKETLEKRIRELEDRLKQSPW